MKVTKDDMTYEELFGEDNVPENHEPGEIVPAYTIVEAGCNCPGKTSYRFYGLGDVGPVCMPPIDDDKLVEL